MNMTIEEIQEHPIYGNHYQDHDLLKKLDRIILNETLPIGLRASASSKVYEITKLPNPFVGNIHTQVAHHTLCLRRIL